MNFQSSKSSSSTTLNDENPWPGLLSFREQDSKYFHGRDFESEMLYRRLKRERLTTLFAPSGLGKSSLLQAGLFPLLRRDNLLPVYIRLDFSKEKPNLTGQVKTAIFEEAERAKVEAPRFEPKDTLWEFFHRRDADFWSDRHQIIRPLLVFDQFEEIFTLGARNLAQAQETNTFLTELADLVEARPSAQLQSRLEMEAADSTNSEADHFDFEHHRYKLLISLREDFLPDLETLSDRMGSIAHNRFRLGHMNAVAALQVVNQAPAIISEEVAERIVRFISASEKNETLVDLEVEPALLSVVCNELNLKRQETGESRITEQTLEGSQRQVLSEFYERSINDLDQTVCTFVEEKLLTAGGFRNLLVYEEAISVPGVSSNDIEELIKRRLIRVEERGRLRLIELSHDLLIGVVTASRDARRQRAREAEAVRTLRDRLEKRQKKIAAFSLVTILTVVALGGLAWAYFAQQQADRLAKAIEQAEQAAAEASRQTKIAETQRLEAERQRQQADRAREFSESAASEASRQQQIADTQREEAFRQRQQALRARADAETAASEAFLQKNLAEQQRTIAEERQTEIAKNEARVQETNQALVIALQERLSSNNPDEVIGALDILLGSNEDANQVLAQLDENWFTSTRGLTPLLLSLNSLANVDPSVQQVKLRQMLVNRLAENSSLNSPPVSLNGVQRVRLGAFYIQQYEVTNGEYRQFNPKHNTEEPDKHPVTKISWYDAMIYSAWLGGTLPSAAEWEHAASGNSSRVYPWGNDPPNPKLANYASQSRRVNTNLKAAPVGSYPEGATPELIHDLAGNVWEWCRDSELDTRILKGGSYFNTARFLENTSQNLFHPEETGSLVGFRVLWPISLE